MRFDWLGRGCLRQSEAYLNQDRYIGQQRNALSERLQVQFVGDVLQVIVRLRCAGRVKGVGLDDVRAGFEVGAVDFPDHIGLSQAEQIIIASQVVGKSAKRSPLNALSVRRRAWIMVPMAPSSSKMRSDRSCLSLVSVLVLFISAVIWKGRNSIRSAGAESVSEPNVYLHEAEYFTRVFSSSKRSVIIRPDHSTDLGLAMVTITESAQEYLLELLEKQNVPDIAVRGIYSGCGNTEGRNLHLVL